ncbi:N-acyl-D-amino-acid deacylase family protein [Romboutsia sp.]|uniref:N-acyl-D-amino-acid deacylase family protein n=1 Tax=Romboutsia sp. TaxID=1965302 RepID=UPI003F363086
MYDIKIINGKIVDFDNNTFNKVDIGIKDGKIVEIGNITEDAINTIDAKGKIVSPGFIDIHMHEELIDSMENDNYDIANKMCLMGVTTAHGGNCGINIGDTKEFIGFINKNGAPINYVMSIGYNTLREKIGVLDNYREANDLEIEKVCKLIKEYEDLGVVGLSFGIEYSPGITFEEMLKVCNCIKGSKLFLSAHFRSDCEKAIESVKEMIDLSRKTNLPMQISHLGSCSATGMMNESIDLIQKSIDDGLDITVDCYPYDAFSTYIGSAIFDEGCFERWEKDYDSILLTEGKYKGVRCDKETFYYVRENYPDMLAVAFVMNEEEVIECIKAPFVFVGSDGLFNKSQGHPRGAGTFPRLLGRFVREKEELTLIEALKKITILPSKRLGLENKGSLKVNMDADIVIFDENNIIDKATFENPTLTPVGIDYVIVNGKIAVKDNTLINSREGKYISRS